MNEDHLYVRILEVPKTSGFSDFAEGDVCELHERIEDTDGGEAVFGALYRVRKNGIDRLFFGHELEVL